MVIRIPPIDCLRAREAASARVDEELSGLEVARLDAHLRDCAECRAFAAGTAAVAAELQAAPLEPAPLAFVLPARRPRVRVPLAAAAAILVVSAAGSSFLVRQHVVPRAGSSTAATTTAAATDPGLLAMLQDRHWVSLDTSRVFAV